MPRGSRRGRARRGVSQQGMPSRVLCTLYGSKLCTLKSLLLTLLASPSESEHPVGNSKSHSAQGQDLGIPPAAGSNQSLYSDLLHDFRTSAEFPTVVGRCLLTQDHGDKNFRVSMASEVAGSLVRDTDSVDYLKLLNSSYVVLHEGAPRPGILEFMQRWSQTEVVHRIIELQFQQTSRPGNVLCAGYRKLHPGTSSSTKLDAPRGLECAFRNTSVEILKSQPWVTLLSRVGDALMLYLLSNASIFIPLHGSSFLQIAGPAINSDASKIRNYFESVEREPPDARSEYIAPSRPTPAGTYRPVPRPEQKRKAGRDMIGYIPRKATAQQSEKDVQLQSISDDSKERKGALKRKWAKEDSSDLFQGVENDGNGKGPGRNSIICSVSSKRSKMTCDLQSEPKKRKVTSGWDCPLVNETGRQSSGHLERRRWSSQAVNGPTVSAHGGNISIIEVEQANEVQGGREGCTQRGESILAGRKRARPSSWQRRKARKLQETNTQQLPRVGSPQTESKPPSADVKLDQLFLSENLPPLNADSQNLKQRDPIRHLVEGARLADICRSSCSGSLECASMFLDNITHEPSTHVEADLSCVGSSCKTAAGLPMKSVELAKPVIRSSIFYSSAFSRFAGLPRKHILNTARPNSKGALQLFGEVFRTKDHTSPLISRPDLDFIQKTEPLNCKLVRHQFKGLLRNSRKCSYARLLNRHCPLPWTIAESMGMANSEVADVLITPEKELCTKQMIGSERGDLAEVHFENSPNANVRTAAAHMKTKSVSTAEGNSGTTLPISTEVENFDTGEDEVTSGHSVSSMEELISSFVTHRQVVAFLWAVTRSIIPVSLLGCRRSWRALLSSLSRFVSLRRYEKFSLKQYLFRLKTGSFDWLRSADKDGNDAIPAHVDTTHMLESWSHWYFTSFVVPLIRAHFYVTESENSRRDVFYYRKPVWARIKAVALNDLVATSFQRVSPSRLTLTLLERVLGFSKIRFVPKRNSVRPIVNLGAPSKCTLSVPAKSLSFKQVFGMPGYFGQNTNFGFLRGTQKVSNMRKHLRHFKSVNSVLRDVHSCLKADLEEHAEDLGCSVFGYNDTYLRLVPFVMKLKSCENGLPQLYFGVCDVAKAFDTIKQQKLCEVIGKFVSKEQYSVFRYVSVIPTAGTVRVCFRRACTTSAEHQNFLDTGCSLNHRSPHAVYVDQVYFTTLSRKRILALVHDHVTRSMLQIGSKFYIQTVGIAQGSVLSSLFCSLFYGHLDKHYLLPCLRTFTVPGSALQHEHACTSKRNGLPTDALQNLLGDLTNRGDGAGQKEDNACVCGKTSSCKCLTGKQNSGSDNEFGAVTDSIRFLLLRLTDDSLFVSTSKDQVSFFVEKMHNGFAEYGCRANQHKTALSFDINLKEHFIRQSVYQTDDGARFMRWSGLLINCHTLEIQADYSRYSGQDIRSTLTVVVETNQGYHLSMKLCQFMRPKCHPLFYDLNINSPATVRLNAYQAFLLCAMKFHAYARAMPPVGALNPNFLLKAICTAIRYMHRLIQQRMQAMKHVTSFTPCFSFPMKEMQWLGLMAFRKVLWRKQCGHKKLILLLEAELGRMKYSDLSSSLFLNYAVDDRRSSMFHSIQY